MMDLRVYRCMWVKKLGYIFGFVMIVGIVVMGRKWVMGFRDSGEMWFEGMVG